MERRDLVLQGWDIDHKDIEIAKHEDGTEWLLGAGSYGKACPRPDLCMPSCRRHSHGCTLTRHSPRE